MSALVWTATSVALDTAQGPENVSGWRYGDLFIDFRAMNPDVRVSLPFCWMVSHVPTGLGIIGLLTDRSGAQGSVESLYPLADWCALRGHTIQPSPAIQDWIRLLPVEWCMARETIAAFTTVYRAGTVQ